MERVFRLRLEQRSIRLCLKSCGFKYSCVKVLIPKTVVIDGLHLHVDHSLFLYPSGTLSLLLVLFCYSTIALTSNYYSLWWLFLTNLDMYQFCSTRLSLSTTWFGLVDYSPNGLVDPPT